MKKIISLILTAMLVVSLVASAYAESAVGFTPTDVMQWYLEDLDDANPTVQSSYIAAHLVENLVYVTGLNANEEQLDSLESIMSTLREVWNDTELSDEQRLGIHCVYILKTLIVLAHESDPSGTYNELLQGIVDDYNEADATIKTADMQAVNALYTSVKLAALVVEECCTSQEQIDQIEAGLSELNAESKAASVAYDHMIIGTKWLRKMLGAFAKLNNPNCADAIDQEKELREGIVAEMTEPMEIVNQYLTSSMFVLGLFTGDYSLN